MAIAENVASEARTSTIIKPLTHSGVVVQVNLDVALDNSAESAYEIVNLAGVGASDCVGNTDTVNTNLVYRLVD